MLACERIGLAGRLSEVSLALRAGELVALVGPNGAGKSSLMQVMAGLLAPTAGDVALNGARLADQPARERARAIGYLPQVGEVAWDMAVEVLAGLGRLPWGGGAAADHAAVERALAAMELDDLRHRAVSRLSGGERARALLARVLAGAPQWILADEPLASLDLAHAASLMARLGDQARAGIGVVVAMHDLAMAMNHADRVVVLAGGRLVADGLPQEALAEDVVARVWGVKARWLGEAAARALAVS